MKTESSNIRVAEAEQSIEIASEYSVRSGEELIIQGKITNYTGKEVIECVSDNQNIAGCTVKSQPDKDGKFQIAVKGLILV